MTHITYSTKGTCSKQIDVEVNEHGVIENVKFTGGCSGNTQGVSALIVGMQVDEAIRRLEGIKCGPRSTSCPDQLACALKEFKNQ